MKQIAQYQDGRLELQEVPMPLPPPGGILVRTTHSVISVGTERMKIEQAKMNLLQKARARPDQVKKVLDTARNLGWRSAYQKVRNRLESPRPLGYSAAGVVVAVDAANTRFRVGDRVACGGAECAFHAEYLSVPDMLAAPVPVEVESWQAAYTTLCAIALQAIRQAEIGVGDHVLVMGQGLVGLLVTNLAKINGARVMAVDVQSSRRSFAEAIGAERVVISGEQNLADEVRVWTGGFGADAAIVCTASQSNEPIEQAAEALRDRGRLVDVGITRIELPWKLFYEKELEFRFSRSYGPGRYDPAYEWGGQDYPIGYVRWTEQRNFEACLHLMALGEIKLDAITTRRAPFADALQVYQELTKEGSKDVGVVLEYPAHEAASKVAKPAKVATSKPQVTVPRHGRLNLPVEVLDVIGAGNFARTMLLPHVQGKITLGTVVNQTSLSANHVRNKFGFSEAATDAQKTLEKREPRAVLIATRHHLHAPLLKAALTADRHVFVEKPLCLSRKELEQIDSELSRSSGSVMIGFNRRFAPASAELKQLVSTIPGPKTATYRVMAGKLDPLHWYANIAESGGRIVGEACHFLDYFCFIFGAKPTRVIAQTTWPTAGKAAFPDSVAAQVEFEDGSCGQLVYSAEGDTSYPKESFNLFGAGLAAEITNFQKLEIFQGRKRKSLSYNSKGHAEEMDAWLGFLKGQQDHPLPYEQARTSMLLTFAVIESIQARSPVELA